MNGAGTVGDPWQVADYDDLKKVGRGLDADTITYALDDHYLQTADIDASASATENGTTGWVAIPGNFEGSYDGDFYSIDALYASGYDNMGIFELVRNGTVRKVRLTNLDFSSGGRVGGIAGSQRNANISDCYVQGSLSASGNYAWLGGIAGVVYDTSPVIERCVVVADISSPWTRVGGIAGDIDASTTIRDCYFSGSIEAGADSGGIAGYSRVTTTTIDNCYASFTHTGDDVEGILGNDIASTVANSFWDTTVGPATSFGGTGKTTTEMQDIQTYTAANRTETITGEAVGTGDGTQTVFQLNLFPIQAASETIYLDGAPTVAYTLDDATGALTFDVAPVLNAVITADYVHELTPWDMVTESSHDGEEATATWFIADSSYPALWFEYAGVDFPLPRFEYH